MVRRALALAWLVSCTSVALGDTPDEGDVAPVASSEDAELNEQARGAFRIENEWKLSVPDDLVEPFREWLRERYGTGEGSILPELGPDFTVKFSDEHFTDRYFDNPRLEVLASQGGIRHRTRRNLEDAAHDRKHGRQLVQLKLRRPGDQELNRTEIKFEVNPPEEARSELDRHPLIGLVDRDQQQAFIDTAARFGFDAREMSNTITLEQRRWRVYISKGGKAFSTLTLDEVSSYFVGWGVRFTELEIELNEVAYTEANRAGQEAMEQVSQRLADDIFAAFPAIKQDQTPKYNKVYDAFAAKVPAFRTFLLHRDLILTLGLLGVVGGVVGGAALWRRRAAKRPAA